MLKYLDVKRLPWINNNNLYEIKYKLYYLHCMVFLYSLFDLL